MATVLETVQGMIDATIRRAVPILVRGNDTALGTLVERDPSGLSGRATFDPSANPVPVKISGGLDVFEGDRVGMVRTGGYWMVVGSLSVRGMGSVSTSNRPQATTSTTSSTFVDCVEIAPLVGFRKFYEATDVEFQLDASGYTTVASNTQISMAARLTGIRDDDGTAYDSGDVELSRCHFNALLEHGQMSGGRRQEEIPAGLYTVTARWRRLVGTGTANMDTNDWHYWRADERRRQD